MAITFVGSATDIDTAGANSVITLPAMNQDDLVLAFASVVAGLSGTPAGYTNIATVGDGGGNTDLIVARKFMGASPDTTTTFTGTTTSNFGIATAALVFRGVDTTTPLDVTSTTVGGNSADPDPPAITPSSANCAIVTAAGSQIDDAAISTPTGYSTIVTTTANAVVFDQSIAAAYKILTGGAGASEDPVTFSFWTSAPWAAITIALRPLAAGQPARKRMGGVKNAAFGYSNLKPRLWREAFGLLVPAKGVLA